MPQNNKPQIQQPNPRTTIISVVLFLLVAFFVGQQFMSMSESSQGTTDKLVASEFLQAVDQNRVTEVTYSAGDYTVSGTYYPAVTAGDSSADAGDAGRQGGGDQTHSVSRAGGCRGGGSVSGLGDHRHTEAEQGDH